MKKYQQKTETLPETTATNIYLIRRKEYCTQQYNYSDNNASSKRSSPGWLKMVMAQS